MCPPSKENSWNDFQKGNKGKYHSQRDMADAYYKERGTNPPSHDRRNRYVNEENGGNKGVGKADDFARTTFLPDEYYAKLDNNIANAINARDAEVARIQSLSKTQQSRITTVVGGVDLRTGQVTVGVKNSKINKGNAICAEDLVFGQLGGNTNANIIMTPAIRPRTGQTIPVCTRCQLKFPENQFIKGTVFD